MYRLYDKFGVTDQEELWNRVTYTRLLEFINDDKTIITENIRSTNNHGEFRFITIVRNNEAITFFGHGLHEYRNRYYVDKWAFYPSHLELSKTHNKAILLSQLNKEHLEYKQKEQPKLNTEQILFNEIADIADDDGAYSELI